MSKFASVEIEPFVDLKTTSEVVGDIFGKIKFKFDDNWDFDEFPAYISEDGTYEYALLGIPDPEHDIRDNPANIFQLEVYSIRSESLEGDDEGHEDISEEIAAKINKDGRLTCSV